MTRSVEQLPPFSGDDPICAKCGQEGASTLYEPARQLCYGNDFLYSVERLHRRCSRCSFTWHEAVVTPT